MKTQSVLSVLFLATSTITGVDAAVSACNGGLNVILGLFGQNPSIQSYCTASYPIYTTTTLTSTSTSITTPVTTTTQTVTQTITVDAARKLRGRQLRSVVAGAATTASSAVSAAFGPLAILQGQAKSAVSTYCSCQEQPQTVRTTTTTTTVSSAPFSTSTVTTTTTATVVRPKCASPGSNLVQNGGFESGLSGWSLTTARGSGVVSSPGENSASSFQGVGTSQGVSVTVTQTGIAVRGGITYTVVFSGMINTADVSSSVAVAVDDTSGTPTTIGYGQIGLVTKTPGTWYQKSFTFTPSADTTVQIRAQLVATTQATVYADNISMSCS